MGSLPRMQGIGPASNAYLASALSFVPGVVLLGATREGTSSSRALVAGFALECAMKAFLAHSGMAESDLKKKPCLHDLEALWLKAVSRGLKIPSRPPAWVELLNTLHNSPYHLRYPTLVNGLVLPGPEPLTADLQATIAAVKAVVQP